MSDAGWRTWEGDKLNAEMNKALRRAVEKVGYVILAAAKQQVPHDEGTLERSGQVLLHQEEPVGVVCFGGGPGTGLTRLPYAVQVHEQDRKYQKGRKWHYLRDPFVELAPQQMPIAVAEEIGDVLK